MKKGKSKKQRSQNTSTGGVQWPFPKVLLSHEHPVLSSNDLSKTRTRTSEVMTIEEGLF
jgi:hypothetical protein